MKHLRLRSHVEPMVRTGTSGAAVRQNDVVNQQIAAAKWTPTCHRCIEAHPVSYRIATGELNMLVCEACAKAANDLGLAVQRIYLV